MSIPLKSTIPGAALHAFRNDLLDLLRRHGEALSADQILALAAYTVGQLVALQDQRIMTPETAMEVVAVNIQAGNTDAIEHSLGNPAGEA